MKKSQNLYLARGGQNGEDEEICLEQNLAIIGFQDMPSLDGLSDYEAIADLVRKTYPDRKARAQGNFAGQLWAFAIAMKEGDLVVLPRKLTSQIAIGQVCGPYQLKVVNSELRHTRRIKWLQTDIPRSNFKQDLLYSFGAFMTVCKISRNNAAERVAAIIKGKTDPGAETRLPIKTKKSLENLIDPGEPIPELGQLAHDQIVARIQSRFSGHELTRLVEAVLQVEGWATKRSPPGPDGGVDILAGRGSLGLDPPRLCVQVKSQQSPADVTVYRTLQGSMQTFNAEQGLLVCWGGFNRAVHQASKQGYFSVRLWDSSDLVSSIYRNYNKLPAEIQAEIPLKQVWALVLEDTD